MGPTSTELDFAAVLDEHTGQLDEELVGHVLSSHVVHFLPKYPIKTPIINITANIIYFVLEEDVEAPVDC
jgi:hypothetical protein